MGKYLIMGAALGIVLAAQPLTEAAASVYAARELTLGQFASPSSLSLGLPKTAIGKGTGRVHIPAGAENLVGEERLPGGVLGIGAVGHIGMAVHGCDGRTMARSLRVSRSAR